MHKAPIADSNPHSEGFHSNPRKTPIAIHSLLKLLNFTFSKRPAASTRRPAG